MKKIVQLLGIIGITIFGLQGCKDWSSSSIFNKKVHNEEISKINAKIEELETTINDLSLAQEINANHIGKIVYPISIGWSSDAINQGFQWLQCDKLPMSVSFINAQKYLNGYKLSFIIGNPHFARIDDIKLKATFFNGHIPPIESESASFFVAAGSKVKVEINAQGIQAKDLTTFGTEFTNSSMKISLLENQLRK